MSGGEAHAVYEARRALRKYRNNRDDGSYVDEDGLDVADALEELLEQFGGPT